MTAQCTEAVSRSAARAGELGAERRDLCIKFLSSAGKPGAHVRLELLLCLSELELLLCLSEPSRHFSSSASRFYSAASQDFVECHLACVPG